MFSQYVAHGWKLCRIEPGTKGPKTAGWNLLENAVQDASTLQAAGLLHAYSGTCALDIDDMEKAAVFLQEHDIDLKALLRAPEAVQINSGRANRGKLLYVLSEPLTSKTFANGAFELRCGTVGGRSAQDVLPPSPHPSGTIYQFIGNWRQLPTLPDELKALWLKLLDPQEHVKVDKVLPSAELAELRDLLSRRDPDVGYDDWIRCGMAASHESGGSDEGFQIWNEWSSKGSKYPGAEVLRSHWVSFGRSTTPVTANSLRRSDTAVASDFDVVDGKEAALSVSSPLDDPAPEKQAAFTFLSLAQLFDRPEPSWLIPSTLPDTGLGAFWGQPGGGKTFLAVDTALTVALGNTWRGTPVLQGPVLYIAAEDDSGVQARFASGLAARGVTEAPIRVLPAAPVFTDDKQTAALLKAIHGCGKQALTFIDTLAAVTPGSDENAGKDMSKVIAFCQKIQRVTGGLVLLIHHEGKTAGKGLRGWSGLHGAFDVEWHITDEEHSRQMYISKLKNAPSGNAYGFQLLPAGRSCFVEWL